MLYHKKSHDFEEYPEPCSVALKNNNEKIMKEKKKIKILVFYAPRGPNAVLKKIKNGNFKVTSRFLGREKKNFPPSEEQQK